MLSLVCLGRTPAFMRRRVAVEFQISETDLKHTWPHDRHECEIDFPRPILADFTIFGIQVHHPLLRDNTRIISTAWWLRQIQLNCALSVSPPPRIITSASPTLIFTYTLDNTTQRRKHASQPGMEKARAWSGNALLILCVVNRLKG
jgi:hypothetical protein